jgi:hypothetical protein
MKHTEGKWTVHHHSHIDKEQWLSILHGAFDITHNGASHPAIVACSKYSAMTDEENLANAERICEIINAAEGMSNEEAVKALENYEEIKKLLSEMIKIIRTGTATEPTTEGMQVMKAEALLSILEGK